MYVVVSWFMYIYFRFLIGLIDEGFINIFMLLWMFDLCENLIILFICVVD